MEYKEKVKITYSKKSEGDFYKFVNELVKALFDSEMYTDIFIRSEEKIIEFHSNKRFKVYLKTFSENRKDIILIDSEEPEVDFRVMLSETGTVFKIRTRIGCSRKEIMKKENKDV